MSAPKIALGLGDNVDYEIVWNAAVVEELVRQYDIRCAELAMEGPLATERDLVISILRFVQAGIGGERHVGSSAIVEQFAGRFAKKITLGGTSVRAAIAMRVLGHRSSLHLVTTNEHVRRLIPQDSPYVCSGKTDSLHPHLIVQFGAGARVAANDIDLCAPRANRIIYHDDADNVAMVLDESFGELLREAQVVLASGFNAMRSEELLIDRLGALRRILAHLPPGAEVFYEDAGFYNPAFHQVIHRALDDRITIFSLNEDELQGHVGRSLDLLDPQQVAAALEDLRRIIPVPITVVHSMYWALAYGEGAARLAPALKGGVTMATTRFRHGDDFTPADYHRVAGLPPTPQGAAFCTEMTARLGRGVCCVPVAQVEQADATTIGLGDAFVGGFLPALIA
jgi:ADP-dependent phosphofructokinase/glucokinase